MIGAVGGGRGDGRERTDGLLETRESTDGMNAVFKSFGANFERRPPVPTVPIDSPDCLELRTIVYAEMWQNPRGNSVMPRGCVYLFVDNSSIEPST